MRRLLALLVPSLLAAPAVAKAPDRVEVVFHVMSQCPFAVRVEDAVRPVLEALGDRVDFRLVFIGEDKAGDLTSMHGDDEVQGDLLQVCTARYAPRKLMAVVTCMNKDMHAIPGNFDACAREAGAPGAVIQACATADQGRRLLAASFKVSRDKEVRGSPTMFIGGEKYQGGRTALDFGRAICAKLDAPRPSYCTTLPEPTRIPLVVLGDARCKDCNDARILSQLQTMFPGLQARTVDWAAPEGRALWDRLRPQGLSALPAFLFGPELEKDPAYDQVRRFTSTLAEYRLLQIGAKWDPTREICDNGVDDDGNGSIDCADPGCAETLVCRKETPGTLDVFVMSQCPFAVKGENAFATLRDAFGPALRFRIHFIADDLGKEGFKALHGQPEVDENLRQVCAIKHYPKDDAWLDYILCRNEEIRSTDWKPCARGAVQAKVLEACATGPEGRALLSADVAIAKALGIGASPTWLVNNRFKESGISPTQIRDMVCRHNPSMKVCTEAPAPVEDDGPPAGGCGGQ